MPPATTSSLLAPAIDAGQAARPVPKGVRLAEFSDVFRGFAQRNWEWPSRISLTLKSADCRNAAAPSGADQCFPTARRGDESGSDAPDDVLEGLLDDAPGRDWEREFIGAASDPLLRCLAQPPVRPTPVPAALVVDQIAVQIVRRFQAGGTARLGAVRLEFGDGALAGGSVLVASQEGQLSIRVEAPPGADVTELAERLERRLRQRGLSLASFEWA